MGATADISRAVIRLRREPEGALSPLEIAVLRWLDHAKDLDPSERETSCGMCGADHAAVAARAILEPPPTLR